MDEECERFLRCDSVHIQIDDNETTWLVAPRDVRGVTRVYGAHPPTTQRQKPLQGATVNTSIRSPPSHNAPKYGCQTPRKQCSKPSANAVATPLSGRKQNPLPQVKGRFLATTSVLSLQPIMRARDAEHAENRRNESSDVSFVPITEQDVVRMRRGEGNDVHFAPVTSSYSRSAATSPGVARVTTPPTHAEAAATPCAQSQGLMVNQDSSKCLHTPPMMTSLEFDQNINGEKPDAELDATVVQFDAQPDAPVVQFDAQPDAPVVQFDAQPDAPVVQFDAQPDAPVVQFDVQPDAPVVQFDASSHEIGQRATVVTVEQIGETPATVEHEQSGSGSAGGDSLIAAKEREHQRQAVPPSDRYTTATSLRPSRLPVVSGCRSDAKLSLSLDGNQHSDSSRKVPAVRARCPSPFPPSDQAALPPSDQAALPPSDQAALPPSDQAALPPSDQQCQGAPLTKRTNVQCCCQM